MKHVCVSRTGQSLYRIFPNQNFPKMIDFARFYMQNLSTLFYITENTNADCGSVKKLPDYQSSSEKGYCFKIFQIVLEIANFTL